MCKFSNYNEKTLIMCQSPLQIVCAAEWISQYDPKECDIVFIVDPRSVYNFNQMFLVASKLQQLHKAKIEIIENKGRSTFFEYVKFVRKARKKRYKNLVIGGYGSFHQALVANIDAKVFLVDDGLDAIDVFENFQKFGPNWGVRIRGLKVIRFLIYGLAIRVPEKRSIKFFSFILRPSKENRVIAHGFDSLKKMFRSGRRSSPNQRALTSFFIDTPLAEIGYIDSVSKNLVLEFAYRYSGCSLVYVPHRQQEKVLPEKYKSSIGVDIIVPLLPIEIEFLIESISPELVFTTGSTAAVVLKKLFPECQFIDIDMRAAMKESDAEDFVNIYRYLPTQGIEIISLADIVNQGDFG
jgi:hypothetical protein